MIYNGIAKRKTAVAKVFLIEGTGEILINNKEITNFNKNIIIKSLQLLNLTSNFDIKIFVKGGGIESQLNSIQLAISKALAKISNINRQILKKNLLLKNDSRIKERRKYGLKKARKASQYSKR